MKTSRPFSSLLLSLCIALLLPIPGTAFSFNEPSNLNHQEDKPSRTSHPETKDDSLNKNSALLSEDLAARIRMLRKEANEEARSLPTRRIDPISGSISKKMMSAYEMIDPASAGGGTSKAAANPNKGIKKLERLAKRKNLNANEQSLVWNLIAYGRYTLGDVAGSIAAYEEVLEAGRQGSIMLSLESNAHQALAKFHLEAGKYELAIQHAEKMVALGGALGEMRQTLGVLIGEEIEEIEEIDQRPKIVEEDYLPRVKVAPKYPRKALSRRLSGWVTVAFTIATDGKVKDLRVIENCAHKSSKGPSAACANMPNDVFDKAALDAVKQFEYQPRTRNGSPVEVRDAETRLSFDTQ